MKIEKLMWASTDQLRQEMVSKINEIIDKVNEPVEMNSPAQRNGALSGKKEECARCEFDKLPGEYTLPFNYEIPHSCKEDKKEEPKSGTHVGILLGDDEGVENVTYDGKEIYSKEPKSTLRGDIKEILCEAMFLKPVYLDPTGNKDTDKIISLFKDTLLKEVQKAEPLRIPGESLEFTSGQEWTMRQIKQIIKNL